MKRVAEKQLLVCSIATIAVVAGGLTIEAGTTVSITKLLRSGKSPGSPSQRRLAFDSEPLCDSTCTELNGGYNTICVTDEPLSMLTNNENIPVGWVTLCQKGCEIYTEITLVEGGEILEVFEHLSCEEGDYPQVGKGGKPKAGAMIRTKIVKFSHRATLRGA